MSIRTIVWNEYLHEREHAEIGALYPQGMHACIATALSREPDIAASTATLDEPEHGLTQSRLDETDVLVWWGHMAHDRVSDVVVDRVHKRVLEGMGLVVLHSGHHSKIFKRLMGTTCSLSWREAGERERIWVVNPSHPIAAGLDASFVIDHEEMYGEPFGIPEPEQTVLISWFRGGEVFRSGVCYERGAGRIFYFRPGHETYPTYHHPQVQRVIVNAARWAQPRAARWIDHCPNVKQMPEG
jgi:trehalose utilization protein